MHTFHNFHRTSWVESKVHHKTPNKAKLPSPTGTAMLNHRPFTLWLLLWGANQAEFDLGRKRWETERGNR